MRALGRTAPALRRGARSGTAPALRRGARSGTAPALRGGAGLLSALLLAGCAARQPHGTTPGREEIVVEEATVVQVPRAGGVATVALPPLPEPLASTSQAFRNGYARAQQLLRAPGPSAPPEPGDEATAQAWLDAQFKPWLEQRLAAIVALVEAFAAMSGSAPALRGGASTAPDGGVESPREYVVASALLGLVNGRTHDQLTAIPAPAHVRADAALLRVYQSELHTTLAGGLLGAAIVAHRSCAVAAARQREPAFGRWLELCDGQLAARLQQQSRALALREAVQAERAAERAAAEGPRPAGPEICWTPSASELDAAASRTAAGAPPTATGTAPALRGGASLQAAEPKAVAGAPAPDARPAPGSASAKPRKCALDAQPSDPLVGQPLTARDLRYGPRDPESGVRVSAALADNPTMDARPLAWIATQSRLARCFAKHVPAAQAVTVSVHANLSVGAQGKTQSVALTPEPSDASVAPSPQLAQCLKRALQQTAFGCSSTGQPTQARATFCLRRD